MPAHRISGRPSGIVGALAVLIAAAALLVPGAGVAGATPPNAPNFFVVTPGASLPSPLPCGAVAEFATPRGFQFPVAEMGSILTAFRLPTEQAPGYLAEFKLLGTYLSSLTLPTPTCGTGSSGVVGE